MKNLRIRFAQLTISTIATVMFTVFSALFFLEAQIIAGMTFGLMTIISDVFLAYHSYKFIDGQE